MFSCSTASPTGIYKVLLRNFEVHKEVGIVEWGSKQMT